MFEMIGAKEKFEKSTRFVHELWQTDFIQFRIIPMGLVLPIHSAG
jgi:hypothetical protein